LSAQLYGKDHMPDVELKHLGDLGNIPESS